MIKQYNWKYNMQVYNDLSIYLPEEHHWLIKAAFCLNSSLSLGKLTL